MALDCHFAEGIMQTLDANLVIFRQRLNELRLQLSDDDRSKLAEIDRVRMGFARRNTCAHCALEMYETFINIYARCMRDRELDVAQLRYSATSMRLVLSGSSVHWTSDEHGWYANLRASRQASYFDARCRRLEDLMNKYPHATERQPCGCPA